MNNHARSVLCILLLVVCFGAEAKDKPWLKLSNDHFVMYSQISEKRSRQLLLELEKFRAAVLQILTSDVPETAPKSVIMVPTTGYFSKHYSYRKGVGGFATQMRGYTLIVIRPSSSTKWANEILKHEYSHALLNYRDRIYPRWYNEGLAELVSTLVVNEDTFDIGNVPARFEYFVSQVDWNELLGGEVDPHNSSRSSVVISAYVQSWLLVHYLTLGNPDELTPRMNDFLRASDSMAPVDAFREAFGQTPEEMWSNELKAYLRKLSIYRLPFDADRIDDDIVIVKAGPEDIGPVDRYLRLSTLSRVSKKRSSPDDLLAGLQGEWSYLDIESRCDDPMRYKVLPGSDGFEFTTNRKIDLGDGIGYDKVTYRLEKTGKGKIHVNIDEETRRDENGELVSWELVYLTPNAFCWQLDGEDECTYITQRCMN